LIEGLFGFVWRFKVAVLDSTETENPESINAPNAITINRLMSRDFLIVLVLVADLTRSLRV
jgi:hypothetical protein